MSKHTKWPKLKVWLVLEFNPVYDANDSETCWVYRVCANKKLADKIADGKNNRPPVLGGNRSSFCVICMSVEGTESLGMTCTAFNQRKAGTLIFIK